MSTNYYARSHTTLPGDEGLHIGQHAQGWEFLFRAHPQLDLTSSDAWHEYLSNPDVHIYAESGYELTLDEFWPDAVERPADVGGTRYMSSRFSYGRDNQWRDDHGCPFANYEFC